MKSLGILIASIIISSVSFSQTVIIGCVKDEKGVSLVGANVYLEGTYDGTSSNSNGTFKLTTKEIGKQILIIDFIGFKSFEQAVVLNGYPIELSIVLQEAFNELNAVTITAGTFEAGDKKKSIAITSLDMVTTAGSAGDVYGALRSLPGTTTVGESGKLYVKGGDSRESNTYIDGTLVYVPYSSSAPNTSVRGRFNPYMFSGTMFSTGGYSAEYGQALSSVLSLTTNEIDINDELNIGILSVGGDIGGTKAWKKASLSATFGYNNLKPYMFLVPQNNDWINEPTSMSGDISFRLKTPKSGMLKFYSKTSQSKLELFQNDLNNPGEKNAYRLVNDNIFANASWTGELKKDWILYAGTSFTNNNDDATIDSLGLNKSLQGIHTKVMVSHKLSQTIKIKAGTELYSKQYCVDYISSIGKFTEQFSNNTLTGFLESEIYTSQKFVTRLGSRFEYSDFLQKGNFAPRLSTAYKLTPKSQVSLSYGWFFQNPDDDFLVKTNGLDYEQANHYTFNYILKGNNRELRSELYYKEYKKLFKYGEVEPNIYTNNGNGYAYGLDIFWRDNKTIKRGEYWVSYSYINAERNYLDFPEQAVPNFTSKHNLTFVYKHWIGELRSLVGGTYRISSPRYYNNPNTAEFNAEQTIAYQSLDLNWSFLYRQNIIFYASASNVLGFKQQFGYQYASKPNENGAYNSQPILPSAKRFFVLGCFITLTKKGDVNQLDKIN
ncbi:MAG: TonB-dependent receptor [Salinivirgaceae bacterium]|nr:TonB-dependent receptor [Salinivirgaceae bacterium]